jgi:predicted RNA polymerase sigma factor
MLAGATRTGAHGRLLRLEEQDRSAWDREPIAEADRLVVAALSDNAAEQEFLAERVRSARPRPAVR